MELIVGSRHLLVDMFTALDAAAHEHLVVIAKASWRIPEPGQRPTPLPPTPLAATDEYVGEPGESAMRYGCDFVRFKPRCDLLFDASAHSPDGRPVTELGVGWRVGSVQKTLKVTGPRTWQQRFGLTLSKPQPFTQLPLHYGLAFGGTRHYDRGRGRDKDTLCEALPSNPDGIGWAGEHTLGQMSGQPAPCLEAPDKPVRRPDDAREPIAFSAIGRHWAPRKDYAGTYDERWRAEVFPFLPEDFDERYHQCAPVDQQIDYPKGGEEVVLLHMMPGRAQVRFTLPRFDHLKMRILRRDYTTENPVPVVDTLYVEPDAGRFSAIWRASVPIRRRLQEFDTLAVGPVNAQWWREKVLGLGEGGCKGCGPHEANARGAA